MEKQHTCASAFAAFEQQFRSGRAPALRGSEFSSFDAKRLPVIRSHWEATFDFIAMQCDDGTPASQVLVWRYLSHLDNWAFRAAKHAGDTDGTAHNSASAVRLVCLALFDVVPGRDRILNRLHTEEVPQAWRAGYELLNANPVVGKSVEYHKRGACAFRSMVLLAAMHGVRRPQDMPRDMATWHRWGSETRIGDTAFATGIAVFRRVAEMAANDQEWPYIGKVPGGTRSAHHIPDLARKLAARGCDTPVAKVSLLEICTALYPRVAFGFGRYLKDLEGRVREGFEPARTQMVSRLCFTLDHLGFPADGDLVQLYTTLTSLRSNVSDNSAGEDERQDLNNYAPPAGASRRVSVARAAVMHMGTLSAANSSLYLVEGGQSDLPFYTPHCEADVRWLYEMTEAAHKEDMLTHPDPAIHELWQKVAREHEAIGEVMAAHNKGRVLGGRVNAETLLNLITLPQALLIGCLQLRNSALTARSRWLGHGGALTSRHFTPYADAVWKWMLATLCLADSLRPKNYAGALANKHVTPQWHKGMIVGLTTYFVGMHDERVARLKKNFADGARSEENKREYDIPRALLDSVLLTDFWIRVRPHKLVACGALRSMEEYDKTDDYFAVFPSRGSKEISKSKFTPRPGRRTGRYASPDSLSDQMGRIAYWMIRDVMFRKDIPEWDEPEIVEAYRGLFAHHLFMRALNASFWGYECEDWGHAEFMTNDTNGVLKRHYARIRGSKAAERERHRTGIDGFGHFKAIMQHIRRGGAVEWARFDPEHPDRAIVHGQRGEGRTQTGPRTSERSPRSGRRVG